MARITSTIVEPSTPVGTPVSIPFSLPQDATLDLGGLIRLTHACERLKIAAEEVINCVHNEFFVSPHAGHSTIPRGNFANDSGATADANGVTHGEATQNTRTSAIFSDLDTFTVSTGSERSVRDVVADDIDLVFPGQAPAPSPVVSPAVAPVTATHTVPSPLAADTATVAPQDASAASTAPVISQSHNVTPQNVDPTQSSSATVPVASQPQAASAAASLQLLVPTPDSIARALMQSANVSGAYYVVTCGRRVGIFTSWLVTRPLVSGVPRAAYIKRTDLGTALAEYTAAYDANAVQII